MMNSFGIKKQNKKRILFILGFIFLLSAWSFLALIINNEMMLPSVRVTARRLVDIFATKESYFILFSTIIRLLISVGVSVVLGFLVFILVVWKKNVIYFLRPFLAITKTTPVAALIIILLIWFGAKYSPIIICIFVLFPLVVETLLLGLERIDTSYIEEMQLNGQHFVYSLTHVYVPFVMPYFYMTLLQCLGLGMKVMVTSELISQTTNSIGLQMYLSKVYLDVPGLFAWTIVLIALVIVFEIFIQRMQKRIKT